ncbi:MAG: 2,3-dehydroadipyl-CoA hydratase [Syntrophorhabdaceae bacterium PtaU1.Bin034]|nr:MAG: 2,3-dehydroadipyl-CoA hydratase [Syntrophorhabdaceae bacterium PtaU1.Bin034]
MNSEVRFEKKGSIAYITLDRPEALNALNRSVLGTIDRIFTELEEDNEIIVAVITGAGEKSFVAGADVREIKEAGKGRTAMITEGQHVLSRVRTSSKVVIAAVNGYALGGGCELALACDIRIASENAKFGLPEASLAVMAGYGGTQLLARLIGPGRAKYMMFSGMMLNAEEAFRFGLVEKVCAKETLMDEVDNLAKKIASFGPLSIKGTKRAIDGGIELPLGEALKFELELYDKVANAGDAEEGLSAFLEKRKPVYRGK